MPQQLDWEGRLINAFLEVSSVLNSPNAPRSANIDKVKEQLIDIRLRLAFQTGNYERWGL
jgi:hypothetical protein